MSQNTVPYFPNVHPPVSSFPGGSWALPMPASGCPAGMAEGRREVASDEPRGPHVYSDSYHLWGGGDPWRLRQGFWYVLFDIFLMK